MAGIISFLFLPFLAGVVLATTPVYLGTRVLERGATLGALTLAQLAALGETISLLSGHYIDGADAWFWSFTLTLGGALFFTLAERWRPERIPRDAVFSIVYVTSLAAAVIVMSRATGGTEYLRDIVVGNLLAVKAKPIIETSVLYAIVGFLHGAARSSMGDRFGTSSARHRRWVDFLFYASLGAVLASAVAIGGVLLAFSYLLVPAIGATLIGKRLRTRLLAGFLIGVIVSAVGIALAYALDAPTGATIVCTYTIVLASIAALHTVRRQKPIV